VPLALAVQSPFAQSAQGPQLPQLPPQPSSPQVLPAQFGVHWGFFFFFFPLRFFLASVVTPRETRVPPRSAASAPRRERIPVRERVKVSKRESSMGARLSLVATATAGYAVWDEGCGACIPIFGGMATGQRTWCPVSIVRCRRRRTLTALQPTLDQRLSGKPLEEALAWCLVWLMAKGTPREGTDLGRGPFLARS
jgi:hypothetical protein